MELLISKVASSALEIVVMSLVPFIWWLITARKKENFFRWLGFKKIDSAKSKECIKLAAIIEAGFILLSFFMLYIVRDIEELATNDFAGLGMKAIPAILVYAVFNTALPEEILFRGFILKVFSRKFGFKIANYVQCIIFGLIHGVMFIKYVDAFSATLILFFTMAIACYMGQINEKKADGSIIPSWGIHAIANIFSGLMAAFSIF